ncbi:MAG: tRNA dihydrouridine synthase DusB [Firmicutes bacterium]|nr:tRNA dihydrouridine synthase DusB [Bacillota bacterium]
MAGVTDRVFRQIIYELHPGLAYTEMISAMALVYANKRTFNMLNLEPYRPLSVQIFGSDPEVMAKAARIVEKAQPTFIDINMGCPTPKIVKNGEGSALMKTPDLAAKIVEAVAQAATVPVTVKIRAGWDEDSINAPKFAQKMVEAGAQAVTVHGRTRSQFYSGEADWDIIGEVAQAVDVPVIGNGDISTPLLAEKRLAESGCAGVMIGRGALGNPWLVARCRQYVTDRSCDPEPTYEERIKMACRHLDRAVAYLGEAVAVPQMRKHIAWYLKGMPKVSEVKSRVQTLQSPTEVKRELELYLEELRSLTG